MPETIDEKADAILLEGRLRVTRVLPTGLIVAEVVGTTGNRYALGFDPTKRQWRCQCPVPGRRACSHLVALRMVVDEPLASADNQTTT